MKQSAEVKISLTEKNELGRMESIKKGKDRIRDFTICREKWIKAKQVQMRCLKFRRCLGKKR